MGQKRRRKPRKSTSDTCGDSTNAEPPIPLDSETVTEPREDSSSTEPDLQIESSSSGVLVEAPPNDENGGSSDDNVDTKKQLQAIASSPQPGLRFCLILG